MLGIRVGQQGRLAAGEKAFQQQCSGDLVDEIFSVDGLSMAPACGAGAMPGGVEQGVGFEGGQPFVEQMVCQRGLLFSQRFRKSLGFGGLWARGAIRVQWIADDHDRDLVLADEAGDGLQVGAKGRTMQRKERLRGQAELVGNSKPDAAVADVERENAGRSLHENKCTETNAAWSWGSTSMIQRRGRFSLNVAHSSA